MAGPPSLGGTGSADVALRFGNGAVSVGSREGYASSDPRSMGTVEIQGRYYLGNAYLQAGFFHFHETPVEVLKENPLLAVIGSAPGIIHRSGLGGGFGYDMPLEDVLDDRLGAVVELTVAGFPDPGGPPVYMLLDFGLSVDIGKR